MGGTPATKRKEARGPHRGIMALIAGCLIGGGVLASATSSADPRLDPEVAAVQSQDASERAFAAKRNAYVRKLNKELAEVDEQVEMIDDMIDGRKQAREGEGYDDFIERGLISLENARAQLRYARNDAGRLVERARTASPEEWSALTAEGKEVMARLSTHYDETMRKLH